jgi:ribosome biogenesis GTPase
MEERLNDYLKLQKESNYSHLDAKQIEKKKMQEMFSSFDSIKNAKKYLKTKDKRKFDKE